MSIYKGDYLFAGRGKYSCYCLSVPGRRALSGCRPDPLRFLEGCLWYTGIVLSRPGRYISNPTGPRPSHRRCRMPAKQSSGTMFFRTKMVGGLLICAALWFPGTASSADLADEKSNESSSRAEQSPEEAVGGRLNLLRMRKACEEDVKKLCPQIRSGGGRIIRCLQGQPSHLSPACRQVLGSRSANP